MSVRIKVHENLKIQNDNNKKNPRIKYSIQHKTIANKKNTQNNRKSNKTKTKTKTTTNAKTQNSKNTVRVEQRR